MKESILVKNTFVFALLIVKYTKLLMNQEKEYILSKQLLRSGTSIGANISEAQYANSKADFIAKMHIALKESNETDYWLNIIKCSGYSNEMLDDLIRKNIEIRKILIASIKTAKSNKK